MNCNTCKDSGWSGDYHPCPDCELGWGIAEQIAKEQYEKEQYEREMREYEREMEEEYYRKYPHG